MGIRHQSSYAVNLYPGKGYITRHPNFMQLIWLDSNSWLIEIARKRILLEPWLVSSLIFNGLE